MKDDVLFDDIRKGNSSQEKIDYLRQVGVSTYTQLLALLGDSTADPKLRVKLCGILWDLYRVVDKRYVVKPLVSALLSNEPDLVWIAACTIGSMGLRLTVRVLSQLAADKNQPEQTRHAVIQALGGMADKRAAKVLWAIVDDETDDLMLRTSALEQTHLYAHSVQRYITLLSHPTADFRFWAAYCLGQAHFGTDISPALDTLDRVVSTDHALPISWGWHVDREALLPFERIYAQALYFDVSPYSWIISPTAEFLTFVKTYRRWDDSGIYATDTPPPVSLFIDQSWLIDQLRHHWPTVLLNSRQPRPQAYFFDFQLLIGGQTVIGGLHRDGYTLVVTGDQEAVCTVAAWYHGLFPPEQPLFLYAWADEGLSLTNGITAHDIRQRITVG